MIREIQEQRRKEENEVANYMIKDIQAQQKLARHLMREAETRTRVKPPPSRRQLTKKTGTRIKPPPSRRQRNRAEVRRRIKNIYEGRNTKKKKTYTV